MALNEYPDHLPSDNESMTLPEGQRYIRPTLRARMGQIALAIRGAFRGLRARASNVWETGDFSMPPVKNEVASEQECDDGIARSSYMGYIAYQVACRKIVVEGIISPEFAALLAEYNFTHEQPINPEQ